MSSSKISLAVFALVSTVLLDTVLCLAATTASSRDTYVEFYVYNTNPQDPQQGLWYWSYEDTPAAAATSGAGALNRPFVKVEFNATMNMTGWDVLKVITLGSNHPPTTDSIFFAYAAGFGEGITAQVSTRYAFNNLYGPGYVAPPKLANWMQANNAWMAAMIENATNRREQTQTKRSAKATRIPSSGIPSDLEYWLTIDVMLMQFSGLLAGLNYFNKQLPPHILGVADPAMATNLTEFTSQQLLLMNQQGDQMDLGNALNISGGGSGSGSMGESAGEGSESDVPPGFRYAQWFGQHTHCSSLIALTPDNSDVYMGHATWGMYSMMLRVFKTYDFDAFMPHAAQTVTFSSYPGVMVSIDDYYTTSTGLIVTETSFNTFNASLYSAVVPNTVLYWLRVAVANRLTNNGKDWTEVFGWHNSGTYNAQWMVLDLKKFTPHQDLPVGTLWISEQFPGLYWSKDVTGTLASAGQWGSFNLPYNRTLFDVSGTAAQEVTSGMEMNSWQLNVRAQIWRRDWRNFSFAPVGGNHLSAFQHEMQYNNYMQDPISQGNPTYAIAARGDFGPGAACWGAIDAKVASWSLWNAASGSNATLNVAPPSAVYNGPTPQQGPFQWSTSTAMGCTNPPPSGLVDLYNFTWLMV